MADHIDTAKGAAVTLDQLGLSHPIADRVALCGLLHALIALHEQAEPKPTRTRTTTAKADK